MGRIYDRIDDHQQAWIAKQSMFFVGTAPSGDDGHINVSPKGPIGSLRVLDDHTVAYLDIVGSGAETIAHLRENGRICVMLCAFEGPPRILRLHGHGEYVRPDHERFDFADASIPQARRAVIVVDVARVSDSCGYGVPLMTFEGLREHHALSSAKRLRVMGAEAYEERKRTKNARSLDGLPAVS